MNILYRFIWDTRLRYKYQSFLDAIVKYTEMYLNLTNAKKSSTDLQRCKKYSKKQFLDLFLRGAPLFTTLAIANYLLLFLIAMTIIS